MGLSDTVSNKIQLTSINLFNDINLLNSHNKCFTLQVNLQLLARFPMAYHTFIHSETVDVVEILLSSCDD